MFEIAPILSYKSNRTTPLLSSLAKSIIKELLYYKIFHYPLTTNELFRFCPEHNLTLSDVQRELTFLEENGFVKCSSGFYHLEDESVITRRKNGTILAKKYLRRARFMTSLIARFPFVECVCISGSLSKGYMDKKGDVDYFVITRAQRLWICRTLLMLFKKIFLFNSKKYFCINYFISSDNLEVPDKNIFTATEIATLIPLCNFSLYQSFIDANKWTKTFYPNSPKADGANAMHMKNYFIKRLLENLLGGSLGRGIDTYFLDFTVRHWKEKFPHLSTEEFDVNMRSKKSASKHHPQGFQFKVLNNYMAGIEDYEAQFNIRLN